MIKIFLVSLIKKFKEYFDHDLSEIFKHSKNYFLATIALKISSIITIPIYTRYLSLEGYGFVSLFNSYLGLIIILFPLYLYSAVGRYHYENKLDFGEFVGNSLLISVIMFLVSVIIVIFSKVEFFNFADVANNLTYLLFIIAFMKIISGVYYQIIVPQKESKLVAKLQIIDGYLNLVVSLTLVIFLKEKYLGPIYGIFISSFAIFIYTIIQYKKTVIIKLNFKHLRYILLFSLPQLPYALGGVILEQFGRIFLGNSSKISDLGIYSLGIQISVLFSYLTASVRTALLPDFYDYVNNSKFKEIALLQNKIINILVVPAFALISFAREIIYILADSKFHESYLIVPYIVIGYLFFDLFYVYSPFLEFKKHTWVLSLIVISSGILNLILSYYFILNIGYIGAGYAFSLSYIFMFTLTYAVLHLFYKIHIPKVQIFIKSVGLLLLFISIVILIDAFSLNYLTDLIIRIFLFLLFLIIHYFINIKAYLRPSIKYAY